LAMIGTLTINKRRFIWTVVTGFAALLLLIGSLFFTGKLFAAFPLTGIGGFQVNADYIEGTGFELWPAIGETAEKAEWPQAAISMATNKIQGLVLSKALDVSKTLGKYGIHKIEFQVIPLGEVNGKGIKMNVTGIKSDVGDFVMMTVKEKYSKDVLKTFTMGADKVVMEKATINAHSLTASSMSIPMINIKVVAYDANGKPVGSN